MVTSYRNDTLLSAQDVLANAVVGNILEEAWKLDPVLLGIAIYLGLSGIVALILMGVLFILVKARMRVR